MLKEIQNARQVEGKPKRRWFSSRFFDLIVWFENDNEITGFQLCYNISFDERGLTWLKDKGFSHNSIDEGENIANRHKGSPILIRDGSFDNAKISLRFINESKNIDESISKFVYEKSLECNFL